MSSYTALISGSFRLFRFSGGGGGGGGGTTFFSSIFPESPLYARYGEDSIDILKTTMEWTDQPRQ